MGREESKLKHMTMEGDHRETHYNVELTLDPEQGSLHANVELLCSSIEQQCSNLEFYLHKSMEIKSITAVFRLLTSLMWSSRAPFHLRQMQVP